MNNSAMHDFDFSFITPSELRAEGSIKSSPEDFVVEEILSDGTILDISNPEKKPGFENQPEGNFLWFLMRKKGWATDMALKQLAKNIRVAFRRFNYAGTKDRVSFSIQLCSGFAIKEEQLSSAKVKDIEVFPVCRRSEKVKLGELLGNRFVIKITSLKHGEKIPQVESMLGARFPNYFGMQRFGSFRRNNHIIGKCMLAGDYEGAVMEFLTQTEGEQNKISTDARKKLKEENDFRNALNYFPKYLRHERILLLHLAQHQRDFVNALRKLPRYTLLIFLHSLQSYIFNLELSMRIKEKNLGAMENEAYVKAGLHGFPDESREGGGFTLANIIGYETELNSYEEQILEKTGISKNDFLLKSMPELSCKGSRRTLLAPYSEFAFAEDTGTFSFMLPSGAYATCFLREFFKVWL